MTNSTIIEIKTDETKTEEEQAIAVGKLIADTVELFDQASATTTTEEKKENVKS